MNRFIEKLLKSEYFKNISVQVLGTGIAQLIPFLIMPILSRIYNEKAFADFSIFTAITGVLIVACGARYHFAIVLPKKTEEANKIFLVSVCYTIAYSILILLGITIFNLNSNYFNGIVLSWLVIPLFVFFYGCWISLINLSIRQKLFKTNSFSKITQSSSNGFTTVLLGFFTKSSGLVIGKIMGVFISSIYLIRKLNVRNIKKLSKSDFIFISKKYKDFPVYTILPSLLNSASTQAPIFIIGHYFSKLELGYFGFTFICIAGPLSIIGVSFRDVFYQKAAETFNKGEEDKIMKIFKSSVLSLILLGAPIFIIIYFFGETLFSFIFGEKWSESGRYASILILSFVIKLIVSPLSNVFNVLKKLKVLSLWQITYFVSTFITLIVTVMFFDPKIELFLKVYLVHEILLYLFYYFLQYWVIKKYCKKHN